MRQGNGEVGNFHRGQRLWREVRGQLGRAINSRVPSSLFIYADAEKAILTRLTNRVCLSRVLLRRIVHGIPRNIKYFNLFLFHRVMGRGWLQCICTSPFCEDGIVQNRYPRRIT